MLKLGLMLVAPARLAVLVAGFVVNDQL